MIGKKLYNQNPKSKQNQKYPKNPYKINNKEISPHLNVLQFDLNSNNNNNNNFRKNKNIRNLSQKPIRKPNNKINPNIQNIQNNNYYFNNINNNFIIKNSYPLENQNINNKNIYNNIKSNKKNSQRQIRPLNINNSKNLKNQSNRYDNNKNNQSDKVKIKLDQKGVYISNEEDVYEDPNDPVNKLNSLLDYKQKNNLEMSHEEKNMIETIKKVSSNRVQYRNTHQMLREIGKIMKDPVVSFLIKKDPGIENKEENPSDKLSEMLSQKMLEEHRIKDEIRNKGSFDFAKLPDKDRQMLAQRKVYNKIGLKVYENYANDNKEINNNIIKDKNQNEENIDEKIDNQIKNEINREKKKEEFLNELEKYNEKDEEEDDDYFKYGEINNIKKIKEYDNEDINYNYDDKDDINKEKPTARGILEKVLGKIEYKNEQLINHNPIKDVINNKKDNTKKKNFN